MSNRKGFIMVYNIKEYDIKKMQKYGFKRILEGCFLYRTVGYKYENRPILYIHYLLNPDEDILGVSVLDENDNLYPAYYSKEYGKNSFIKSLDNTIENEIENMKKNGIFVFK